MNFDPENKVVKLCAQGMEQEGSSNTREAKALFDQAWKEAETDFEKFTAAHYVARHQRGVADKLAWDKIALDHAMRLNDLELQGVYPSLYLNIAKGYEDLEDFVNARLNYEAALSFAAQLPADGYGQLVRSGIQAGLARLDSKV